jgi:biopolymer transport protein ExbD
VPLVSPISMRIPIFQPFQLTVILAVIAAIAPALYGQVLQPAIPQNAIVINLDSRGSLHVDQEQITPSALTDRVRDIAAARNEGTAVVIAAANTSYTDVVSAVEAVRAAGIERVGILKSQADRGVKESLPPFGATVLSLDRSGVLRLDGKKMKAADIPSRLQKVFRSRPDHTIYIQAYGALPFDTVATVIDAAKAAGAKPIGLLTSGD